MQNYNDIPQLAGLEEDLALKQEMEAKIVCCKALKCYYIALTYLNGQKWPEARALFQRATIYANKAKNDTIVLLITLSTLQKEVFFCHFVTKIASLDLNRIMEENGVAVAIQNGVVSL